MKKLIVANWKMYLGLRESVALAKKFTVVSSQFTDLELVLCPSFVALEEVAKVVKRTKIKLGAQDVEPEKRGAFTGEVGLDDLSEIGVQYVLVGHSERRQKFGETDALVNKKLRAVLASGMRPILCVGELSRAPTPPHPPLLTSPRAGEEIASGSGGSVAAQKYVAKQVRAGLRGVSPKDLKRVIIAYEPVWAISGNGGHEDTPEDASKMHGHIRKLLAEKTVPILYGGSVNSKNAATFVRESDIDGLLIGRASIRAGEFRCIVESI